MTEYKLVVLGGGGVGKSCITTRLVVGNFEEEYDPTIENAYRHQVSVDDAVCLLDILDTAGQEEFSSLHDQYMRGGKGFSLVYSITSRKTFEEVQHYREKVLRAKDVDRVPMILIGNKADLEDEREVQQSDGRALAEEWGVPFMETSAKQNLRCVESFHQLVREVRDAAAKAPAAAAPPKPRFLCSIL
jgi:GTPase KRas protein